MEITRLLEQIGIRTDDEKSLTEFLLQPDVKDFLLSRWSEFENPPLPEDTGKQEDEEVKTPDILVTETAETVTELPVQNDDPQSEPQPLSSRMLGEKPENESIIINKDTDTMSIFPGNDLTNHNKETAQNAAFSKLINNTPIVLQNGKVNQPYNFTIDMSFIDAHEIGEYSFEGLEELGLVFDKTDNTVKGTPVKPGDFKIIFKCKRKDWEEGKPVFERPVTLVINPDPRSLWNNTPTPTDVPYYKPDSDKQFVKVEATKGFMGIGKRERKDMVAASQRGRSHAHEGTPRDDDFVLAFDDPSEWYIIAVADGAGSAKYSRKGSQIACDTVSEICQLQLSKFSKEIGKLIEDFNADNTEEKRKKLGDAIYNIIGSAVFKAYKGIEQEAANSGNHIKDYSTTLIVSVCKKYKFGWFVAAFWVGDGGIGIYNKDTRFLKIMGEPDGGEFAGQTRFLTMPEIMQSTEIYRRLRFGIVDDFTALILMTDGITDPKFETDANLLRIEKWDQLWDDLNKEVVFDEKNAEIDNQLLKWLDFWSPGNHDDRTIAILF